MTIYGFISDESLYLGSDAIMTEVAESADVGYPSDDVLNYFLTPSKLRDVRSTRLALLSDKAKGVMCLHLDNSTLTTDDLGTSTTEEIQYLYNVIELLYLSQGQTDGDLETILIGDVSNYDNYVPNSLERSGAVIETTVKLIDDTIATAIDIRTWVSFDIIMGTATETKSFKIWLGNEAFKTDYPISNVITIIPPCNPQHLIDTDYANIAETLSESSTYVNGLLNTAVAAGDHTGLQTFNVQYINNIFGAYYNMPFGILYKGATPSDLSLKIIVRDYLEALSIGSVEIWQSLFPDLYTTSLFYLVPQWNNITYLASSELYPSVFPYNTILTNTQTAITDLTDEHIANEMELLNCGVTELILTSVPHVDNDNTNTLLEEHPTYQAIDAQDPTFDYQEAKTREFNTKLSNCMVILDGGTNPGTFTTITIDGNRWLTFITNYIEYHVLYKEDFPTVE